MSEMRKISVAVEMCASPERRRYAQALFERLYNARSQDDIPDILNSLQSRFPSNVRQSDGDIIISFNGFASVSKKLLNNLIYSEN